MNPRNRTAVTITAVIAVVAAIALPAPVFLIAVWVVSIISCLALAAYWYERSSHYFSEATWLAKDLEGSNARLAEVLDENQLLRDDAADAPIPFTIVHGVAEQPSKPLRLVLPEQRDGSAS